jgi:hypothetical protein
MMVMLLALGAMPGLARADACPAPAAQPMQPTAVVPVANELAPLASGQLGSGGGVLSQAYDDVLTLDAVLARLRMATCADLATVTQPGSPGAIDPATYQKRTEFDNTPWRFNMSQDGRNMTADEFSAWMKSRGVRVARGAAPKPAAPAPEGEAPAAAPEPAAPTPELAD